MKARALLLDNRRLLGKLLVVATLMFAFGYALVPMYRAICEALGINVLALSERRAASGSWSGRVAPVAANTQVDTSRSIVVEFDANTRGPWEFRPSQRSMRVHPGEMVRVDYVFRNPQPVAMTAQAIPSYAPRQAGPHFGKVECFCFSQWTLQPGESRSWPVVFVLDPKLPRDVTTITLSYTFFEVGGRTPPAPAGGA
ncbi:cytochrome c oxidase assembly protein [Rubrivivax gelatinosus]|uniref:cytochrome c oxidase assembly protein n=1 Tax=Rubrivivax gelatinosus TaxID=28068 RepID=UPI00190673D2|nr:cytochrome c oxidase assembly protein [Rubrivivax gelatinosus]MBK1614674.1 cytochrome c oxidase assembly protein [Rubrivivax gelatinosus]MBZ8143591.1 cytochrome c oxidase assembly protein [Rubrivivax gelatinosus]